MVHIFYCVAGALAYGSKLNLSSYIKVIVNIAELFTFMNHKYFFDRELCSKVFKKEALLLYFFLFFVDLETWTRYVPNETKNGPLEQKMFL